MMTAMVRILVAILLSVPALQAQGPAIPSSSTLEQSAAAGAMTPARVQQTRTESNGREIITEKTETPDIDGRMRVSRETTTETVKTGPGTTQTKREIYTTESGQRRLAETTQTETQTMSNGSSSSVSNTYSPDVNGRLGLLTREVQEVKSLDPNTRQTDTVIYHPGINQSLRESERRQETEKKVSDELTQTESTRSLRDANGRWQVTESRSQEVRETKTERVEEETVSRLSDQGTMEVSERTVTRQSKSGNTDETVTEVYNLNLGGLFRRNNNRLELDRRVRVTTTGEETIREVEGRNPISPNDPLRVIERTVETRRQVGPDQWETTRQVFALDGNGRLVPVITEKGATAK